MTGWIRTFQGANCTVLAEMSSLGLGVPGGGIPILVTRRAWKDGSFLQAVGALDCGPTAPLRWSPWGACPQGGVAAEPCGGVGWAWCCTLLPLCFPQAPVSSFPSTAVTWT